MYNTRFTGDWVISGVDTTSNVQVHAHTTTINGNLTVLGATSTISATNTKISDNIITLNAGETGTGVTAIYSGIEVDRGLAAMVRIRWNEATGYWELTQDGSTYQNIRTGFGASFGAVVDDLAPKLGGNLDVYARSIFSSNTANVRLDSNLAIQNTTVAPSTVTGYNVIYAQTPGGGESGLYVTNTSFQQKELITKSKAIAYALIM